jgi:hypothetical protein
LLSKYLKCSVWRLAVLYYLYIYVVRRQRVNCSVFTDEAECVYWVLSDTKWIYKYCVCVSVMACSPVPALLPTTTTTTLLLLLLLLLLLSPPHHHHYCYYYYYYYHNIIIIIPFPLPLHLLLSAVILVYISVCPQHPTSGTSSDFYFPFHTGVKSANLCSSGEEMWGPVIALAFIFNIFQSFPVQETVLIMSINHLTAWGFLAWHVQYI